jgi:putative transposase
MILKIVVINTFVIQNKSYKYRIFPSNDQILKINQTFGCVRFIWNLFVESFNTSAAPYIKYNNPKKVHSFLSEVSSGALQQKDRDIQEFKSQFFNTKRKSKVGRPSFKKKSKHNSYRLPNKKFDIRCSKIRLEKIGLVDIVIDRHIPKSSRLLSCTVSKNPAGQYFVSIAVEENVNHLPKTGRAVGIDLGVKDFVTLSDGTKHNFNFCENQAKLKLEQRRFAKKTKGSSRYERNRKRIARLHQKVTNQRQFFQHNLSKRLVTAFDKICVESLNISGMLKNRRLSKKISEQSWSTFISMLEYKSKWYGKDFIKVGRFFPSSKTCSCCGQINKNLQLHHRVWSCSCGAIHDRDVNAAKNILSEGLTLSGAGITTPKQTPSISKTVIICKDNDCTSDEALNK